ncbi:MAG: PhaM family polyhydroxyalkanoate granule multifunctional regulatory protein [Burkholderiales bacterium]
MSEPLPDPFEFLKKLWNPMGLPMPGMVAPTLDIDAVEKKIADLKSVENWLNLNLNMLRLSIQGLEMQRNTLAAMKAMQSAPADAAAQAGKNSFPDPAAWWNMMQAAAASAAAAKPAEAKPAEAAPTKSKPK